MFLATTFNPVLFLGRMHPMLVHLPIGFLILLLVLEITARFKKFRHLTAVRPLVVGLTVAASLLTITLGLMLKTGGGYDPNLIFWHQWTGILFGLTVIAVAVAVWKKSKLYYGSLVASLLLLTIASHFGGSLSHGAGYLTAYAPGWIRTLAGDSPPPVTTVAETRPADARSARLYPDVIRPILAANCIACHGPDRVSGQLRLDTYAGITADHSVTPGSGTNGRLVDRMLLPQANSHHMPPVDKPQPTDDQIALVRWWVESGAPENKTVADLKPSADNLQLVAKATKLPIDDAVAKPVQPDGPPPIASISNQIADITIKTGVVIAPVSAASPWLDVNAAVSRNFGDPQLQQLVPIAGSIQSLDLAGTKITDAGLTVIAKMRHLTRLRLDRTDITDAGFKSIAGLPDLSYLNLYRTKITDASLPTLKALPSLQKLYLWGTGIDPDSAAKFAAEKPDELKIRRWQQQIDELRQQIDKQQIEVVGGIEVPTTKPTTGPATMPATAETTSKPN